MRVVPNDETHPLYKLWMTRALGAGSSEVIWNGSSPKFREAGRNPDGTKKWRYAGEETWVEKWEFITRRADREPMTEEGEEGLAYEAEIMRRWEQYSAGFVGEPVDVIDDEYDFLRAQIDSLSYDGSRAADFKLVRGKDKKKKLAKITNRNCLLDGDPWWFNAQHQMRVTGLDWMDYYVLIDGIEERHFIVRRNEQFIKEYVERCADFWLYVEKDVAPPSRKLKMVRD